MITSQTDGVAFNNSSSAKQKAEEIFRRFGEEASAPFMDLLRQYKDPARDVLQAMVDGFNAAARELQNREDAKVQKVAEQFATGAHWLEQARTVLDNENSENILDIIEKQGARHPEAVFALSLIGGIALGRLGRYSVEQVDSENVSAPSCPIESQGLHTQEQPSIATADPLSEQTPNQQGGRHGAA
ncbi:MAG: hypothetical protein AB7T49_11060 [Oligoflexales bacterium]